MRKIVLYTYYIDEERFTQTHDLFLERELVNIESKNEHELIFAIKSRVPYNIHDHPYRIAIASRPGQVYYDRDNETYRVWFDDANRDKAIKAIGNYILDRVAPEIRTHQSFIDRLQNERSSAMKLLEQLPEV